MTAGRRKSLQLLFSLVLLAGLVWLLHRVFRGVDPAQVLASIRALRPGQIAASVVVALASYATLGAYDGLAMVYLRRRLGRARTLGTSFITYAFNFSLGSLVGAVAMRFHLYTRWGLSRGDITRLTVFCAVTGWIGYALLTGIALTLAPPPVPASLHFPVASFRPLGIGALLLTAGYLALCRRRTAVLTVGKWELPLPPFRMAVLQTIAAALHWSLASLTLYLLFPLDLDLSYARVLSIYLIAALAALMAHVPGGLGVIEGTYVVMLADVAPKEVVLATVLAFRAVFYLLPLTLAALGYLGILVRGVQRPAAVSAS